MDDKYSFKGTEEIHKYKKKCLECPLYPQNTLN